MKTIPVDQVERYRDLTRRADTARSLLAKLRKWIEDGQTLELATRREDHWRLDSNSQYIHFPEFKFLATTESLTVLIQDQEAELAEVTRQIEALEVSQ